MLLVLDHPVQHFSSSFRALGQSALVESRVLYWRASREARFDPGFDLRIQWDVDLHGGYRHEEVGEGSLPRKVVRAARILRRLDPDVLVVYGWATEVAWIAALWGFRNRKQVFFYGDSTWQHSAGTRFRRLRGLVLRTLFRLARGALSTGAFNREFYIWHGMHPAKVFDCVCPVDVPAFDEARQIPRGDGPLVIGFAGKFIARKGVDELLTALSLLPIDVVWRALLIGDGPERVALQAMAVGLGISDRVEFVGFRNASEMPGDLAGCDIVVVPSRFDMRVLVATEAMAAGAAVVVSSKTAVWGRGDLIQDGVTGSVYKSGSAGHLAEQLTRLARDQELLEQVRRAGAAMARQFGPDAFATGVEAAVVASKVPR